MINISIDNIIPLTAFWLIFIRLVAIVFQIPLFDNVGIPGIIKVLVSLVLSYCFYPHINYIVINDIYNIGRDHFWVISIYYMIVGLVVGYLLRIISQVFLMAGVIITQNIGLGAAKFFDPNLVQKIGPIEKLIHWTVLLMVLSSFLMTPLFRGIFLSFNKLSYTSFSRIHFDPHLALDLFKNFFQVGMILSLPAVFIHMVIIAIMGVLARSIPQMNILLISFIVNIMIGFMAFLFISDDFFIASFEIYKKFFEHWYNIIT